MIDKTREALVQSIVMLLTVPYIAWLSFKNGLWYFGRSIVAYFVVLTAGCTFVGVTDDRPQAGPLMALLMLACITGVGFMTLGEREFQDEKARKATEQHGMLGESVPAVESIPLFEDGDSE